MEQIRNLWQPLIFSRIPQMAAVILILLILGCDNILLEGNDSDENDSVQDTDVTTDSNDGIETDTPSTNEPDNPTTTIWDNIPVGSNVGCTESEVADAAGNCVPLCDTLGRCYGGTVASAGEILDAFGAIILFKQYQTYDNLENVIAPSRLWQVDLGTNTSKVLVNNFDDYLYLGTDGANTYLINKTGTPYETSVVFPDGHIASYALSATFTPPSNYPNDSVIQEGEYIYSSGAAPLNDDTGGIWRQPLDGSSDPEIIVSNSEIVATVEAIPGYSMLTERNSPVHLIEVADNVVWFSGIDFYCALEMTMYGNSMNCEVADPTIGWFGQISMERLLMGDLLILYSYGTQPIYLKSVTSHGENTNVYEVTSEWFADDSYIWSVGAHKGWGYVFNPTSNNVERFSMLSSGAAESLFSNDLLPLSQTNGISHIPLFAPATEANVIVTDIGLVIARPIYKTNIAVRTVFIVLPVPSRSCTVTAACSNGEVCSPAGICTVIE